MSICENLKDINQRIELAAKNAGRNIEEIKLVAVTKTHPAEILDEVIACGAKSIGENKIQESEDKLPLLKENYEEFHFIGHLQSNKVNKLMKLKPSLIHSIDKLSTAQKLNSTLERMGETQDILIQINTSFEESKFGIDPANAIEFATDVSKLNNLKVKGLMTIGKFTSDVTEIRKSFRALREIRDELKAMNLPNSEMKELSMGMTNDFEIAIEEGATIIRVGSAIFGARDYSK